ncbi:sulfotransferase [Methylotuvimicrobium sp. KM2]|jgi:hypothetical protein|uniref:sulfotransferase family protein n=1 Tax=Methylotuvimicrobium sp. KM2 TaxID=3133976 RepID=UPI0031017779
MKRKLNHIKNELTRRMFLWVKKAYWMLPKFNHCSQERIFIAGMQRSGTNMLMDILEKSLETDVYHERDTRAFDNYQMRDRQTIQGLVKRSRAPRFIIKALCELQDLTELMAFFQPAKTIWIVRDYDDVVSSMLNSFPNMEKQVIRIVHGGSQEWLGRGMTEETRTILKDLISVGIGDSTASAIQWYFRNMLFFNQRFQQDNRVLVISYEDLVTQPEFNVKNICNFIGIEYQDRMIKGIFSSSIKRRNPPEIDPKVRELCDGLQAIFQKYYLSLPEKF